tara:strand:- start:387 stop:1139 length:753 start_codon:yes stop_codon:yes gene_type:complete
MIIGRVIHHVNETGSTMDDCRTLARKGAPEGTVVSANHQGSGRGRFQRSWVSQQGTNIQASILIRPKMSQLPYLNMMAALAASDTSKRLSNVKADIKWPNDIQVFGKKLCGILIESEISGSDVSFSIVGIGLNVNMNTSENAEISEIATSLKNISGRNVNRNFTIRTLLQRIDHYYYMLKKGQSLTKLWEDRLNTIGKNITLSFPGTHRASVQGTAKSTNENGSLNVTLEDGSVFVASAGEVTLQTITAT